MFFCCFFVVVCRDTHNLIKYRTWFALQCINFLNVFLWCLYLVHVFVQTVLLRCLNSFFPRLPRIPLGCLEPPSVGCFVGKWLF